MAHGFEMCFDFCGETNGVYMIGRRKVTDGPKTGLPPSLRVTNAAIATIVPVTTITVTASFIEALSLVTLDSNLSEILFHHLKNGDDNGL